VLNDKYQKAIKAYMLVKAKLHNLFSVLDKYDWPASRSVRLILAICWKESWIGATAEQDSKISCWGTIPIVGLSNPYLVLISAEVFRLLLKARLMSQSKQAEFRHPHSPN